MGIRPLAAASALALLLGACAHAPTAPTVTAEAAPPAVAAPAAAPEPELDARDALVLFINEVRRGHCEAIAPALAKGVDTVVFDRGGYIYHGRVKALADAAREGGLAF